MKTAASVNLARIDLTSIRLVVLCAETGSLSAAAKVANMSISGASHRLSFLEESLGTKLFERHRRGLRPTRGGQMVASNGRLMLGLLEHLVHNLDEPSMQARSPSTQRRTAQASEFVQAESVE